MGRVFANGPGDWGSIPGRVIPKTQRMVLDTSLPITHHYLVRIKGKVKQSWERSNAFLYTYSNIVVTIEKRDFRSATSTTVANFTYINSHYFP